MAVNIRQDGSFEVEYVGPYGGLNVQMPENLVPDSQAIALSNVMLRNAEIRSWPARSPGFLPSPDPANPCGALGNANGRNWAIMGSGLYRRTTTNTWVLDSAPFAFLQNPNGLYVVPNYRVFQNKVYAVNGSAHLASWDALGAFTLDNATIAGNATGALFIDELDNHLIMANTNENSTLFPQRIRWSASGLPSVWDPAVNINAGLADFIEVPDNITGIMMLGRVGYIFRTDGITEISPTGQGVAPFDFNHMWASQVGIGNGLFWGIAQYGTTGVFISRDNIYLVQAMQLQTIGGTARDAIFADLVTLNQSPLLTASFQPVGAIVPVVDFDYPLSQPVPVGTTVTPNVMPYFVYVLCIPTPTGTKVWVYSFEDNSWTNFTPKTPAGGGIFVSGRPSLLVTAPVVGGNNVTQYPAVVWPNQIVGGSSSLDTFNSTSFNDPGVGSSYSYRMEDITANRVPTVRRIALTYRDLGAATLTVTLTGVDDNQTVQTVSTPVAIGNSVPTGTLMVKLVDLELTAFRPQLTISRAANGGPMSITRATLIGQIEREVTL